MAHHYPAHTQNQAYQSYPAPAAYGYSAPGYYPGYQPRPGGGYAFDGAVGGTSAQPQVGPHSAPELPGVTPQLASHVMERLVSSELRDAGFESAEAGALRRLEREVAEFVQELYERAHDYANLAHRANPIATDVFAAANDYGMESSAMLHFSKKSRKHKKDPSKEPLLLLPPPSRSPSPELLSSDDENAPPAIPMTLRPLPHYVPPLPPKHTYLRTPISPPKKAALPSLEKKLKNAALVQDSLKNLLLATEDNTQEDAELLGATVNWEATTHPRKRWKLS
ncbi:uncharacterized protein TRAVEDRAFT_35317 [Trametes versicolor FP-101664 SS1]|uniref:uncharacterized protein n=1 Tax=Trametes versicolor (strain FP-101664) TaxID=717944 RepID=UPI0004621A4B|nr:uncharacterized protein TRAVEDRAFT_35317 [Trametes versicolor FP-101664 SS1]EIW61872.1 hypothetical protein TRAVEDRAFT_35317 [Trametes versicolor FP-101664 SS1]